MRRIILPFTLLILSLAAAGAQEKLPDGPGKETLKRVCSNCHSPESVAGMAKSREDWGALVGEMAAEGAQGTVDEFNQIVDYLAAYFPKAVNVNKATAKDLEAGLLLSPKEADAMVDYRGHNGNFKSIDDLAKVPGLDAKKIEAKKDRLEF
jgi:competence protein ComEA